MTDAEFQQLVRTHNLRGISVEASRLVLVEGLTGYGAAKQTGLAESTISRALAKLARPLCPHCKQPLP